MVSVITNDKCIKFVGLDTDEKPKNENVGNGSTFYEMNTGKTFMFNVETREWVELIGALVVFSL